MAEKEKDESTITLHTRTYRLNRMPSGIQVVLATSQLALGLIFSKHIWKSFLLYLNNTMGSSKHHDQHLQEMENVMSALSTSNVLLELKKYHRLTVRVEYLFNIITLREINTVDAHSNEGMDMHPPHTITKPRSFLNISKVYRWPVLCYFRTASSMNRLIRKCKSLALLSLKKDQAIQFKTLISSIRSAPSSSGPLLFLAKTTLLSRQRLPWLPT